MSRRAEQLFKSLRDAPAIIALIGEPEDAHIDCKEWPANDGDAQRMLAKAICGMANADGGVLVIGMKAESRPKDEPDIISAPAPVDNASLVRSRLLGLLGNIVEPGIVGLETTEIAVVEGEAPGFVVVHIPRNDASPCRSRKDSKFYQRIGSATLPMEYWQIEAMFSRSANPELSAIVSVEEIKRQQIAAFEMERAVKITVVNRGRGIAKLPALLCRRPQSFNYADTPAFSRCAWPFVQTNTELFSFRGGVDNVIYPGESIDVVTLRQSGTRIVGVPDYGHQAGFLLPWDFLGETLVLDVVCDGVPKREQSFEIPFARFVPNGCTYTIPEI